MNSTALTASIRRFEFASYRDIQVFVVAVIVSVSMAVSVDLQSEDYYDYSTGNSSPCVLNMRPPMAGIADPSLAGQPGPCVQGLARQTKLIRDHRRKRLRLQ